MFKIAIVALIQREVDLVQQNLIGGVLCYSLLVKYFDEVSNTSIFR